MKAIIAISTLQVKHPVRFYLGFESGTKVLWSDWHANIRDIFKAELQPASRTKKFSDTIDILISKGITVVQFDHIPTEEEISNLYPEYFV